MDAGVRAILAWSGQILMYSTPLVVALLLLAFFRQLTQRVSRGDRRPMRVAGFQGLLLLTGAMFCLGMGLALLSLSVAVLVALGFGMILLGLLVAAYGVRLMRASS